MEMQQDVLKDIMDEKSETYRNSLLRWGRMQPGTYPDLSFLGDRVWIPLSIYLFICEQIHRLVDLEALERRIDWQELSKYMKLQEAPRVRNPKQNSCGAAYLV